MKITAIASIIAGASVLSVAIAQETNNAMWVFSQDGIHIFSPNGDEKLVRHEKETACHAVLDPWAETAGTIQDECWAMDPVHDGENYVFVANNDWVEDGFVDVYDLSMGTYLQSISICTLPYHMEYSASREEIWVACWLRPQEENSSNMTDRGTINVIDTQNLDATPISINTRGYDKHMHNHFVMDDSMPSKAYELSQEDNNIYEIDPATKTVREAIALENTIGTYEFAYSQVNSHIFLRTYVCCACGEDKDTGEECASWQSIPDYQVIVEFGPSAGPDKQPGSCGKFCKGTLADVNGLWEFDTETNTPVAQHFAANDAMGAKPFASPKGDYILIGGGDGGNDVKVLKTGANGAASVTVGTINLAFGAADGTHALSDISFIEDDDRNIAVFTSTLNNHIVLADLSGFDSATESNPHSTNGVDLELFETPQETVSVRHDIRGISIRQVTWATGTDYVWVSSPATAQVHVIELGNTIEDSIVLRTLDNIDMTRHFLWVEKNGGSDDNGDGGDGADGGGDGADGGDGEGGDGDGGDGDGGDGDGGDGDGGDGDGGDGDGGDGGGGSIPISELCFSGRSMVKLEDGIMIRMSNLKIGDRVQVTEDGKFDTVYSFGHYQPNSVSEYLRIESTAKAAPITISAPHMLFLDSRKAVPASTIKVGDILLGGNTVTKVDTVSLLGAYAPFTYSGSIVVNDVVASNYVSLTGSGTFLGIDMQLIAHTAVGVRRALCHLNLCDEEKYNDGGVATWIPYQTAAWIAAQEVGIIVFFWTIAAVGAVNMFARRQKKVVL